MPAAAPAARLFGACCTPAPRRPDAGRAPLGSRASAVRRGRTEALHQVDLTVGAGETVALMGRNGAGKSTLLTTLVGLHPPASGTVRVGGRRPAPHQPPRPPAPRRPRTAGTARPAVRGHGRRRVRRGRRRTRAPRPAPAGPWCPQLLPDVPDATHPRDLSEGQRLALALAVVLTARPPLLLLDEPTRGLDYAAKARLVAVLRGLAAEGHAIVLATHDVELAAELAHRVVILADGEIVADGPTAEVVVSSPVLRAAGRQDPRPAALADRPAGARGPGGQPHDRATRTGRTATGPAPAPGPPGRQVRAVRLGPRSVAALALISAIGVVAFGWPLLADAASGLAHSQDAPWLFAALLPLLLAVVVATIADTGLDAEGRRHARRAGRGRRRAAPAGRGDGRASSRCSS